MSNTKLEIMCRQTDGLVRIRPRHSTFHFILIRFFFFVQYKVYVLKSTIHIICCIYQRRTGKKIGSKNLLTVCQRNLTIRENAPYCSIKKKIRFRNLSFSPRKCLRSKVQRLHKSQYRDKNLNKKISLFRQKVCIFPKINTINFYLAEMNDETSWMREPKPISHTFCGIWGFNVHSNIHPMLPRYQFSLCRISESKQNKNKICTHSLLAWHSIHFLFFCANVAPKLEKKCICRC